MEEKKKNEPLERAATLFPLKRLRQNYAVF